MSAFQDISKINRQRAERWHPRFPHDGWTGADWSNAMCGEAGETANVVKKLRRFDTGVRQVASTTDGDWNELRAKLRMEIGDVYLYLDLLAQFYDMDIEDCIRATFDRVSEREGFPERLT
jgi:NTP pyrophosphatase (non-canonical NTP hydrolase)